MDALLSGIGADGREKRQSLCSNFQKPQIKASRILRFVIAGEREIESPSTSSG